MKKRFYFRFDCSAPKNENNGKPVFGRYYKDANTIVIFIGTLGELLHKIFLDCSENELELKFVLEGWFKEIGKTIQEECIHACIEDITGKFLGKAEEIIVKELMKT